MKTRVQMSSQTLQRLDDRKRSRGAKRQSERDEHGIPTVPASCTAQTAPLSLRRAAHRSRAWTPLSRTTTRRKQ
jgi:hypothetical protein